jgi:hypothetical protein
VLARRAEDLGPLMTERYWWNARVRPDVDVWTDDFSSLLTVFEW